MGKPFRPRSIYFQGKLLLIVQTWICSASEPITEPFLDERANVSCSLGRFFGTQLLQLNVGILITAFVKLFSTNGQLQIVKVDI